MMNKVRKTIIPLLLGVILLVAAETSLPVHGQERLSPVAACGVPIPDSVPGEERKDLISGLVGLSILTALVSGGLLILQKQNK